MARRVLGIADVGQNRFGIILYARDDNRQLRIGRYRNDKNSGGLFQFLLCQGNKYGQPFLGSMGGVHRQKYNWFSPCTCGSRDDFHARSGRSDDSFGINNDGRSG